MNSAGGNDAALWMLQAHQHFCPGQLVFARYLRLVVEQELLFVEGLSQVRLQLYALHYGALHG